MGACLVVDFAEWLEGTTELSTDRGAEHSTRSEQHINSYAEASQ
jgi:hypothetical protein